MTKVNVPVIPREVAEAIEWHREVNIGDYLYCIEKLRKRSESPVNGASIIVRYYDEGNQRNYLSAIVNGYTVEKSAEELAEEVRLASYDKIREMIGRGRNSGRSFDFEDGYHRGIIQTLGVLNVRIQGVNA